MNHDQNFKKLILDQSASGLGLLRRRGGARNADRRRGAAGALGAAQGAARRALARARYRFSHSRGSSVDLTIVSLGPDGPKELDMGMGWDYFRPESWPGSTEVTSVQPAHRMLLQVLIVKRGFEPLQQEQWHFTLRDEPYPAEYFDFPAR